MSPAEQSYTYQLFGKKLDEITSDDLVQFFSTEQVETETLEFKSAPIEFDKLYKEVNAFLNSNGGILIIGAPRETTGTDGVRVCVGDVTFDTVIKDKGQLLQKLASHITPPPIGVRIQEIRTPSGLQFVLEIPSSMYAPHQCSDHRYYIRLDTEARPAPHGIVDAIFNRRQSPQLSIGASIANRSDDEIEVVIPFANESRITAVDISFMIEVFPAVAMQDAYNGNKRIRYKPDGKLQVVDDLDSNLVKGLTVSKVYLVRHLNRLLYFNIGYWCKDGELRSLIFSYDPQTRDIVRKFDSKRDGDDPPNFFDVVDDREAMPPWVDDNHVKTVASRRSELSCSWQLNRSSATIVGEVHNQSSEPYRRIDVRVNLYDKSRNCFKSIDKSIFDIAPNSRRLFDIDIDNELMYKAYTMDLKFV